MRLVKFEADDGPAYVNPDMVIGLDFDKRPGYVRILTLCNYVFTVRAELGIVATMLTRGN
jgi:hypothetical protein